MAKRRLVKRTQGLEEWWQHPNALLLLIGNVYRVSIREKLQVELTVSSLLSPTSLMKFTFLFTFDIYLFLYFPWQSSGIYNRWVFKHFNGISFFKNCNDITKNWQKTGDNSILIDIIISELYVELSSYKIQRINF